jgi:hypothetical protein
LRSSSGHDAVASVVGSFGSARIATRSKFAYTLTNAAGARTTAKLKFVAADKAGLSDDELKARPGVEPRRLTAGLGVLRREGLDLLGVRLAVRPRGTGRCTPTR